MMVYNFKNTRLLNYYRLTICLILAISNQLCGQITQVPKKSIQEINYKANFDFLNAPLNNVQIVGLGEVSHYTKECYLYKNKIIAHLVEKLNFNRIAFEVDYGEAKKWNDYIVNGKGNLDTILANCGWWTYQTSTFKSTLEFLRKHNEKTDNKVMVYGMEMTYIKHNLDLLNITLNNYYPEKKALIKKLQSREKYLAFSQHNSKEILEYWNIYFQLNDLLIIEENFEKIPSYERKEFMKLIDIVKQYCTYISQNDQSFQLELRDKFSFRNAKWVLESDMDNKLIIWAHNGHIRKDYSYDQLGRNLHKHYGKNYFSLGFSFGKGKLGSFNSTWKFKKWDFELTKVDSFNNQLYDLNKGDLFINIQTFQDSAIYSESLIMRRDIGEQIQERAFNSVVPIILSDTYDAMIFIKDSNYPKPLR